MILPLRVYPRGKYAPHTQEATRTVNSAADTAARTHKMTVLAVAKSVLNRF